MDKFNVSRVQAVELGQKMMSMVRCCLNRNPQLVTSLVEIDRVAHPCTVRGGSIGLLRARQRPEQALRRRQRVLPLCGHRGGRTASHREYHSVRLQRSRHRQEPSLAQRVRRSSGAGRQRGIVLRFDPEELYAASRGTLCTPFFRAARHHPALETNALLSRNSWWRLMEHRDSPFWVSRAINSASAYTPTRARPCERVPQRACAHHSL